MKKELSWFVLFLLLSCSVKPGEEGFQMPEFGNSQKVKIAVISDELPTRMANHIFVRGDYLLALYHDGVENNKCTIFNKNSGEIVGRYIYEGRGPYEMISIPTANALGDQIYVYPAFDPDQGNIFSFNIDSLVRKGNAAISSEFRQFKSWTTDVKYLPVGDQLLVFNNKGYLNRDTTGYHRLILEDSMGNEISCQDYKPFDDPVAIWCLYQQMVMEVTPSGTNAVIASVWGGILEIYTLPDLDLVKVLRLVDPALMFGNAPDVTENTTAGVRDIYTTDDCFYVSLGADVKLLENSEKDAAVRELKCNDIYVFDWEGNPIEHIEADYNVERFCLTEAKDTMYAIVSDREGRFFIGKASIR